MIRTIHATSTEIKSGRLSALELLDESLERIDRYEDSIRAWVLVDRDGARRQAERSAAEIAQGHWRGPLHGIPVAIKDIIDVVDLPTSAGFRPWARSIARRDATVVERLRQAGAIILGKAVTTQFASFDPSPTRNPWNADRTPGGSSSGSAAAVACGMCLAALGTQTGGSVIRPASYCGVAGCKPTYGRVSLNGIVPLAESMDHVGMMAGCVIDLAIVLQTIAGYDPRDPLSIDRPVPNDLQEMEGSNKPPQLGRLRGLFEDQAEPSVRSMTDRQCSKLRDAGVVICETALPKEFEEVIARHRTVMAVEAARFHKERFLQSRPDYGPHISALIEEGLACPEQEYLRCLEHRKRLAQVLLACFGEVDAWIMPATTSPAPGRDTTGDPAFNSPWSYTGFPEISIPAGWSPDKMPLAIQLVGRPWDEGRLFAAATWCESTIAWPREEPGRTDK